MYSTCTTGGPAVSTVKFNGQISCGMEGQGRSCDSIHGTRNRSIYKHSACFCQRMKQAPERRNERKTQGKESGQITTRTRPLSGILFQITIGAVRKWVVFDGHVTCGIELGCDDCRRLLLLAPTNSSRRSVRVTSETSLWRLLK